MDDYRGITVGISIAKLYSLLLLSRLDKWAEQNQMRADCQAGFRHGRGTVDNAFILKHVVDKYKGEKKPVYAAFIDFKKAYDSVNRLILWECLQGLGLHGDIINSTMAMYLDVRLCVRVGGLCGATFGSDVGVKQGDPLSPLLFGLFIDRLEHVFNGILPNTGVTLAGKLLKNLLYADDLVLLAESPQELQQFLDVLHRTCKVSKVIDMTVNVKKSEAVLFNKQFHPDNVHVQLFYDGRELQLKPMFIYLGILFDEDVGTHRSIERNISSSRKAMYALVRRCYQLNIRNVGLKCRLFDTLVSPILNFGCEVWGPDMLKGKPLAHNISSPAEALHLNFLKQCLGVRITTPTHILLRELDRNPIALTWIKSCVKFWNKIQSRDDADLTKQAMMESTQMASRGVTNGWCSHFFKCLSKFDIELPNDGSLFLNEDLIVEKAYSKWWKDSVKGMPLNFNVRGVPESVHNGFRSVTYVQWFECDDETKSTSFWKHLVEPEQIKIVSQFRMGVHWLNIDAGRFRNGTNRTGRKCLCCDQNEVEDEAHILTCPVYSEIRCKYPELFRDFNIDSIDSTNQSFDPIIKQFMNPRHNMQPQKFWEAFASFLFNCKIKRQRVMESLTNVDQPREDGTSAENQ